VDAAFGFKQQFQFFAGGGFHAVGQWLMGRVRRRPMLHPAPRPSMFAQHPSRLPRACAWRGEVKPSSRRFDNFANKSAAMIARLSPHDRSAAPASASCWKRSTKNRRAPRPAATQTRRVAQ